MDLKWFKKSPVTIKSRHGLYYDEDIQQKKFTVSPQKYNPSRKIIEASRFKNIGIGIGLGSKINLIANNNPGPGHYVLPSCFDLKRRTKIPLN